MNDRLSFSDYHALLAQAGEFHGGMCAGIAIGTRMTMAGLKKIGISDPKGADRKKLIVFVEIDRCCTDAIMALTGCRPGKRTMRIQDYGKMAATFINLETNQAVRVATKKKKLTPKVEGKENPDFATMADEDLFLISEVQVPLGPGDLPGTPVRRVVCDHCGESIMDCRDVRSNGEVLCRPCFENKVYYQLI